MNLVSSNHLLMTVTKLTIYEHNSINLAHPTQTAAALAGRTLTLMKSKNHTGSECRSILRERSSSWP